MQKFTPVSEPIAVDFYSIYEVLGVKAIYVYGYSYKSSYKGYATEENPDGAYWADTTCRGFGMDLDEFIASLNENPAFVDDTYCEVDQYQNDLTAAEMANRINTYFEGEPADAYLPFSEITMDTPCGNYINL